ncbi:hypothetical protein IW147_003094 [Coemansia sp. RSA 720]|nr:hypothetical protein IW147_003094 [Coemansia sp. RSA 720]
MATSVEWQIRVKALMEGGIEKEFEIATLSNETLGDFRNKLATKSHIEPQKQRLIFRGRLLTDNAQKMVDTGMRDGCALHMVARPSAVDVPADSENSASQGDSAEHAYPGAGNIGNMRQLLEMFSSLANGVDAQMTEEQRERLRHTIHDVHRNFGANDGGEWIAVNPNGQYYRIGREAAVGSQMTDEEFARGPIETPNPVTSSSTIAAYEAIPGLISAESRTPASGDAAASNRPAHTAGLARAEPSQALANELAYDLFENVMPRIRNIPGNSQYHFSTSESMTPTYVSQSSANPIGIVGQSLTNLGDAFVELGRSLQALGTEWQMQYFDETIQQQAQSTLQLLNELAVVSPMAVPFLQARLTNDPVQAEPAQTTGSESSGNENSGRRATSASGIPMVAEHQRRTISSHFRRIRRRRAYGVMLGAAPADQPNHPFPGASSSMLELHIEPILFPLGGLPTPHGPQQAQRESRAIPQMIMQHLGQFQPPHVGSDESSGAVRDGSAPGARTNSAPLAGRNNSTASTTSTDGSRVPRAVRFMPNASTFEVVIERVITPASGPHTDSNNPAPAASAPQSEQPQQRANVRDDAASGGLAAEANANLFDAVERLSTFGSQSARSDRSNNSTTTEYSNSTGNESMMRVPRIFGFHMGSNGMQPPQNHGLGNLIEEIMSRTSNPFSTASVFLGAESGSTTSTTRRASVSSNAGIPQTTNNAQVAVGNSETSEVVTSRPLDNGDDNRPPSIDSTIEAETSRAGETRGRALSISSTDFADADECSRRANSVANKRQRSDDLDEAEE